DLAEELDDLVARLALVAPARVQPVEQDDADAAEPARRTIAERARGQRLDGRGAPLGFDRERLDHLRLAVLEKLEVLAREVGNGRAVLVDDDAHLDETRRDRERKLL